MKVFLYILFLPGWLLARIFRINFGEFAGQILGFFVLGLSFYLIINLLAIFLGFSLANLIIITGFLLALIFILSLMREFFQPEKTAQSSFSWRKIFCKENIFFLLPVIVGLIIFLVVIQKGADYNGDPYFHLAIMRKALDGSSLSNKALSFTKTTLNPAYAFPAWQIFLAEVSKITSLDIFTLWSKILSPMVILLIFIWYFLSKTIFVKKNLTLFSLAIFLIFILNISTGYLFQRLVVPDTFCQYLLLPLAFALALKYIFDPSTVLGASKKILAILALVLFFLLIIHGLHYFYYLFVIIFFSLLLLIFSYKDQNFSLLAKKIFWVLGISLGIFIALGLILELKGHFLSNTLNSFRSSTEISTAYAQFSKWTLMSKWALIITPFVVLFCKNRRLIFMISLFGFVCLVYFTPLQYFFSQNLSFIFTERLGINLLLYYLPISLVLGFIIILLDGLFNKFSRKTMMVVTLIVLLIAIGDLFFVAQNQAIITSIFYSKSIDLFVNESVSFLFILASVLTLLLWFVTHKSPNFWSIRDFREPILGFLLMFIVSFALFSYSYREVKMLIHENHFFSSKTDYESKIYEPSQYGEDPQVIGFIKNNLPHKSVILADPSSSKVLGLVSDQYMAYNLKSAWEKNLNAVFSSDLSSLEKQEILFSPKYQIDYVYLVDPTTEQGDYFASEKDNFELIYNQKVQIYRLIK